MELTVYNINGQETSKKVVLEDSIFAIEPNDHAIYLDVKQHLANKRQGTHKAKGRSEISGSTRKIKRQKGTGGARAGSIKNPLFRGGGRVFGPVPRDYSFKLNKKIKTLARKSALTYKIKSECIIVVEDFVFEQIRTKDYISVLKSFNLIDKKSLLVFPESNKNVFLSSRNLKNAKVELAYKLNTYSILNANTMLISEKSVDIINNMLNK
ncbi:MAG: 50S ribosomal protein L4 [Bacteroidetes bacterium GWE2_29_8]|nr:MAG: 50S ribosomal protein L4 [Bacteroidetes bacterium GWE2_29_8]OFY21188.1 MAG: 50S ribosomal protein L4 [Bacteroidetes bacterium GWF2_29_10]